VTDITKTIVYEAAVISGQLTATGRHIFTCVLLIKFTCHAESSIVRTEILFKIPVFNYIGTKKKLPQQVTLAVQMKNCEPLVLGPALAIDRIPGPVCRS
jgi:hypothetical protein